MEQIETNQKNIYSKRISAGRRTYFFDVKMTKSSKDFYIVMTESRHSKEEQKFERQRLFLYKEDFHKFLDALTETVNHVEKELLVQNQQNTDSQG
jgi:hypothetical protein